MKLSNVIIAYPWLNSFVSLMLPYSKIKDIRTLRKNLIDEFEFYCDEEKKLISALGVNVGESGNLIFPSVEVKENYIKEITSLKETSIGFEFSKISISESDLGNQKISLECLDALDGFIEVGD